MAIHQDLSKPTHAQLLAEIALLRAENAKLASQSKGRLSMKVTEKGALSIYGMGRFPVTLYASQWERIIGMVDEIKAFIAANASALARKE
jgi:hypothetical protein